MQPPASQVHGLPLWLQIVSLAIAVFLAALRAIEFFNFPVLYVRLTRDLFFRLINDGEALFCHAVLMARNGPILIQDITLTLKRVGSRERAEKQFPIRISRFGEKVKGPALTAEHHFFSSSPLLYLPKDTPLRAVYLGVQAEYYTTQQRAIQSFVAKVLALKMKYANAPTESPTEETRVQVLSELDSIIRDSHREMSSLVQLEVGEYELSMKVRYEAPGFKLWQRRKGAEASISFFVEEQPLSNWKEQLSNTLRIQATNLLTDANNNVPFPEFQPVEFKEAGQEI